MLNDILTDPNSVFFVLLHLNSVIDFFWFSFYLKEESILLTFLILLILFGFFRFNGELCQVLSFYFPRWTL